MGLISRVSSRTYRYLEMSSKINIQPITKNAGPTSPEEDWDERLGEELDALIDYQEQAKVDDRQWLQLEPVDEKGEKWEGKCWYFMDGVKYTFKVEFEIPALYPQISPEICLPELDGKTSKMYRGGFICITDHFKPLWARNKPKFGIAHAMAAGLAPWLAVEVPSLAANGKIDNFKDQGLSAE